MLRGLLVESLVGRLDGAVLLAGGAGHTQPVGNVRIVASHDDLRRANAGDLVVALVDVLQTDAQTGHDELVARWKAANVAGVLLVAEADDDVPAPIVDAADRAGVPVLRVAGAGPAEIASTVMGVLLTTQRERLERILAIHEQFARVVASGGGSHDVALALHGFLDAPVAVVTPDGQAVVVVPADAPTSEEGLERAVRRPIVAGDDTYGTVAVLTDSASLDDDDLVAIEQAAVAIAVRFAQSAAFAEAQERFAAISLEQLIAGRSGDPGEIAERARSFGWDLHRPRAVLLASIDPPIGPKASAILATIAAAARATLGRDAIVWVRSATVAALIAPDTPEPVERRQIAERLRAELDVRVRTATISIGVGRRVDDPSELARSFDEASRAVDVGRWAKGRHATAVYDVLGIERLLASASADDLDEFVEHAIGPLLAYDRTNGTDLVATLGVWLESRNMAAAARQLHVHYNTLKNRLERIEAVLGPIVHDADRVLECAIAVHVAEHYDGPWSS